MGVIRTTLEGKASPWGMQGGSCPCHRWSSAEPLVGNPGLPLGAVYERASAVLELWDFVPSSSCGGRSDLQAGTDPHVLRCWTPLRNGGAAQGRSRARTAPGNGRPAAAPGRACITVRFSGCSCLPCLGSPCRRRAAWSGTVSFSVRAL